MLHFPPEHGAHLRVERRRRGARTSRQVLELRRHGGDVAANGGVGAPREEPRQEKKETHGSMVVRGGIPGSGMLAPMTEDRAPPVAFFAALGCLCSVPLGLLLFVRGNVEALRVELSWGHLATVGLAALVALVAAVVTFGADRPRAVRHPVGTFGVILALAFVPALPAAVWARTTWRALADALAIAAPVDRHALLVDGVASGAEPMRLALSLAGALLLTAALALALRPSRGGLAVALALLGVGAWAVLASLVDHGFAAALHAGAGGRRPEAVFEVLARSPVRALSWTPLALALLLGFAAALSADRRAALGLVVITVSASVGGAGLRALARAPADLVSLGTAPLLPPLLALEGSEASPRDVALLLGDTLESIDGFAPRRGRCGDDLSPPPPRVAFDSLPPEAQLAPLAGESLGLGLRPGVTGAQLEAVLRRAARARVDNVLLVGEVEVTPPDGLTIPAELAPVLHQYRFVRLFFGRDGRPAPLATLTDEALQLPDEALPLVAQGLGDTGKDTPGLALAFGALEPARLAAAVRTAAAKGYALWLVEPPPPGPGRARAGVRAAGAPSVAGALRADVVARALARWAPGDCLARTTGRVTVKFVVSETGAVAAASIVSSTVADAALEQCVLARLREVTLPKPTRGVAVVRQELAVEPANAP